MTLDQVAQGYASQVEEAYAGATAAAMRRDLQNFLKLYPVLSMQGEEQYAALRAIEKRLNPYRSIFKDVPEDKDERAAFVLALVQREKSLQ